MAKTEEVETLLREALDTVVQHGVVLIHGEYGVIWNELQGAWTWDREMFLRVPHCCCVGAYMITQQPQMDPMLHRGDIYDAALEALKVDRLWLRDMMNGFDDLDYQGAGGFPDAYALGVRLRKEYKPVCFEYLALAGSGVRVTAAYRQYLQEFCLPPHGGLSLLILPSRVGRERPSGVYPTVREADEAAEEEAEPVPMEAAAG